MSLNPREETALLDQRYLVIRVRYVGGKSVSLRGHIPPDFCCGVLCMISKKHQIKVGVLCAILNLFGGKRAFKTITKYSVKFFLGLPIYLWCAGSIFYGALMLEPGLY